LNINIEKLTLASFDVCAVTAVNGVCSGSGTSMAAAAALAETEKQFRMK